MSFQAYLDNIKTKTGKDLADFRKLAIQQQLVVNGTLVTGRKAGDVLTWLKSEFALGHGHAMAVYAALTGKKPAAQAKKR